MANEKATGFMTQTRQTPIERDPVERVNDWIEIYVHQPEPTLKAQGMRCMDCGVPFCHTGREIKGMASGCPINNLIPEWNDLVYRGLWREAYERLAKTNNFPEFTGRTCPAPCEKACVLGMNDPSDAVTIKSIENAIIDRAFDNGWVLPATPAQRTGKHVAVIGSGPAGLACADELNKAGHWVTVYERADRIGGLLMYGIPAMKLEKETVDRRIAVLADGGINFVPNCEVGKDISTDALLRQYDAVVVCIGATEPRDLPVANRKAQGVHFAMEFLTRNTKSLLDSGLEDGMGISAENKNVIIIGGGDTGTDCVGTALRHNCKSVTQFEIMNQPPAIRASDNPWPEWPLIMTTDYGQKEAATRFGNDPRRYATMTKAFLTDADGNVTGLKTIDVRWPESDADWRPNLEEIRGSEKEWDADLVLLAMGFLGAEPTVFEQLGVTAKKSGEDYSTTLPNVFTAGDARRGQSLVVWAIREGRGAAVAVDDFLMS